MLYGDVLALHVAQLPQTLLEGFEVVPAIRSGVGPQNAYPGDFRRLLHAGRERRREEADGKDTDEIDAYAFHVGLLTESHDPL